MLRPALPNRPTVAGFEQTGVVAGHPGIANSPRLIQWLMFWPFDGTTLTPGRTSGRPPMVFVFDTSKPAKLGVKNWPDCSVTTVETFHPPITALAARGN